MSRLDITNTMKEEVVGTGRGKWGGTGKSESEVTGTFTGDTSGRSDAGGLGGGGDVAGLTITERGGRGGSDEEDDWVGEGDGGGFSGFDDEEITTSGITSGLEVVGKTASKVEPDVTALILLN